MVNVIITAGGSSSRFKSVNKLLYKIDEKPVIKHTVDVFYEMSEINKIIISANVEIIDELRCIFSGYNKVYFVNGGSTRQESVHNALKTSLDCDYVIIHDGARPFIKRETILACLDNAKKYSSSIVAVKTVDTVKIVDENGFIQTTPDRNFLWNAQTPQIFEFSKIFEAHNKFQGKNFTDDSLLFEQMGYKVHITEGEYSNFKITTLEDLKRIK